MNRLVIKARTATTMLESLHLESQMTLALIMQNDLNRFQAAIKPPSEQSAVNNTNLRAFSARLSHGP